LQGIVTS
jgi:hypothetical protein